MRYELLLYFFEVFIASLDGGHIRRQMDACCDCRWNAVKNVVPQQWSWLDVQLDQAGSIRDMHAIGLHVLTRYWCYPWLCATTDHSSKSTAPSHATGWYGMWFLGRIFITSSLLPCLGAMSKHSCWRKQKSFLAIMEKILMFRCSWSETWTKTSFAVTWVNCETSISKVTQTNANIYLGHGGEIRWFWLLHYVLCGNVLYYRSHLPVIFWRKVRIRFTWNILILIFLWEKRVIRLRYDFQLNFSWTPFLIFEDS